MNQIMNEEAFSATTSSSKQWFFMPYLVCGLAALFYLYEYVLQVSPSVMTTELMRDLKITSVGLGTMAAFYFYAYSPMQLPAGLLYDRFGPRRMITTAILICALGAFFFGFTNSFAFANAGRFFMGIGSAFSFVGVLILIARWFPPRYFALLTGIAQLMSSVGAIIGQVAVAGWVAASTWRSVMLWMSAIGLLLALFVWMIVRDHPRNTPLALGEHHITTEGEIMRLARICKNPQTWVIALYSFAIWAPIAVFATLWDVPYLSARYQIDKQTAANIASMIWWGIGIGSPLLGWWSDHIRKRCLPLSVSAALGVVASIAILYVPGVPLPMMYVLMFLFGAAASGQATSFGVVKDINRASAAGTAMGLNNMAVLLGGVLFPSLVGFLIQYHWDGKVVNGVNIYSAADYEKSLFILPLCFLFSWIMSAIFMRETHCQQQHS